MKEKMYIIDGEPQKSLEAVKFAKEWITSRQPKNAVHDENWSQFVQILAEFGRDYYLNGNDTK